MHAGSHFEIECVHTYIYVYTYGSMHAYTMFQCKTENAKHNQLFPRNNSWLKQTGIYTLHIHTMYIYRYARTH
jgi:hypothetical protein